MTFYSLEGAGLRGFSDASADEDPLPISPLAVINMERAKADDVQQILFNLASETGGRAAPTATTSGRTSTGSPGTSTDYSLGYAPEGSGDGRVHSIAVKVKREGVSVHNRTTYTDRPREERLAARVQTALLHGVVDNPLQATLDLVSSQPEERGKQLVTLRLRLPLKQLVLLSQGSAWEGRLTLWIGARDAAGRIAPVQSVKVPVRIPAPPGRDQLAGTFAYDLRMRMAERGEQTVAMVVQDDLGHTVSFITGVFRVDRKGVAPASQGGR